MKPAKPWPALVLSLGDCESPTARETDTLSGHSRCLRRVCEPGAPASGQPLPLPLASSIHSFVVMESRTRKKDVGPSAGAGDKNSFGLAKKLARNFVLKAVMLLRASHGLPDLG